MHHSPQIESFTLTYYMQKTTKTINAMPNVQRFLLQKNGASRVYRCTKTEVKGLNSIKRIQSKKAIHLLKH